MKSEEIEGNRTTYNIFCVKRSFDMVNKYRVKYQSMNEKTNFFFFFFFFEVSTFLGYKIYFKSIISE